MDRRNFISGLVSVAAGFSILPPATAYNRIWKAQRQYLDTAQIMGFDVELYQWTLTEVPIRFMLENGIWKHVPRFIEV